MKLSPKFVRIFKRILEKLAEPSSLIGIIGIAMLLGQADLIATNIGNAVALGASVMLIVVNDGKKSKKKVEDEAPDDQEPLP